MTYEEERLIWSAAFAAAWVYLAGNKQPSKTLATRAMEIADNAVDAAKLTNRTGP